MVNDLIDIPGSDSKGGASPENSGGRLLVLAAVLLPIGPLVCKVLLWREGGTTLDLRFGALLLVWGALSGAALLQRRHLARLPDQARIAIGGYEFLSALPCGLLFTVYLAAPYPHLGLLRGALVSSLLPLGLLLFARIAGPAFSPHRWTKTLLTPLVSATICLLLVEIVLGVVGNPIAKGSRSENDPSRRYWTFAFKPGPDGENLATSFGFLGREPEAHFDGSTTLLIGDSMPGAGKPVNFPDEAEKLLRSRGLPTRIVNAAMAGSSLEQIKLYYEERLESLHHDVLLLSLYVDDINREFRYSRKNRLYTPSWPQWIQDLYHNSILGKSLLSLCRIREGTFLIYRRRTYDEALPAALDLLGELQELARSRGATLAVFGVPYCTWDGILTNVEDYLFHEYEVAFENWCTTHNVPYQSALRPFIGQPIHEYVISATDRHFNTAGHKLVGNELSAFLRPLITSGTVGESASP